MIFCRMRSSIWQTHERFTWVYWLDIIKRRSVRVPVNETHNKVRIIKLGGGQYTFFKIRFLGIIPELLVRI
jgi:hypothetical protein